MKIVDLHVHSSCSDGTYTPSELVAYAVTKGLSAFALTDHDTTDGLSEAIAAAQRLPAKSSLEVIPGIEFSTEYQGKDVHIIGLDIQYELPLFKEQLVTFRDSRTLRNEKMCRRLSEEAGMDITYQKLQDSFPNSVITRAHYAKYMLAHGYIKNIPEAFDRYIGDNSRYFVPREKVTPEQAIRLILDAGGIPILAHPPLYHLSCVHLEELVANLAAAGLVGIEAIYSSYSGADERAMRRLAATYHLCLSGGSDFHGATKPGLDLATGYGKLFIYEDILTNLRKRVPYAF
ncbi:MAG: PHP domain-containing protein [Lachnospiraceae bacterium]